MDALHTKRRRRQAGAAGESFPLSVVGGANLPRLRACVYNIARRMVRSDVDAEDVTQDVLLQVVRKLPTFRGDSAFPTWLHRVTVNAALSHRRKRAVREERRADAPFDAYIEDGEVEDSGRADRSGPMLRCWLANGENRSNGPSRTLPEVYRKVFLSGGRGRPAQCGHCGSNAS